MIVNPQRKIDQLVARAKEDLAKQKEELKNHDVLEIQDMRNQVTDRYVRDIFYIEYHPYEEWKHRLHLYHIPYLYRCTSKDARGRVPMVYEENANRQHFPYQIYDDFLCKPTFHRDDDEPRNVGYFSAYCPLEKLEEFKVQFYNFIKYFLQGITESMTENCEEDLDSLVNNPIVNSIRNRIEFATVKGETND